LVVVLIASKKLGIFVNMIKKVLSLVAIAFLVTSLGAQDLTFGKGKTHEFTITPAGPDDCPIYMTNNTGKPMVIAYEKVSADYNPGWIISFCDNQNCYSDFVSSDTFTTVAANETVNIKISIMSMGKADTAVVKYAVWNKYASSIVKDTLAWTIYMPQSASAKEFSVNLAAAYPNPTTDVVILPNGAKSVMLFDAKGSKIEAIDLVGSRLNLASMPAGNYLLNFEVNGRLTSQNIILK
jgi:hypothetical protein